MKKIKIQFIGTFHLFKQIELDVFELDYFIGIANRLQLTLEQALLDPYFYYQLKLEKYQNFLDLKGELFLGMDCTQFHQIEVWVNGKRFQKFNYSELNPETTFFPLYPIHTIVPQFNSNQLVVHQIEKGTIKYMEQTTSTENFPILFEKMILNNTLLLSSVSNNSIPFIQQRSDTLVLSSTVFEF